MTTATNIQENAEDKARFMREEKKKGRKAIVIGDGINDLPALSAEDAGIAIREGAEIAREIADITISEDDLIQLVILRNISRVHNSSTLAVSLRSMTNLIREDQKAR